MKREKKRVPVACDKPKKRVKNEKNSSETSARRTVPHTSMAIKKKIIIIIRRLRRRRRNRLNAFFRGRGLDLIFDFFLLVLPPPERMRSGQNVCARARVCFITSRLLSSVFQRPRAREPKNTKTTGRPIRSFGMIAVYAVGRIFCFFFYFILYYLRTFAYTTKSDGHKRNCSRAPPRHGRPRPRRRFHLFLYYYVYVSPPPPRSSLCVG